MKYRADRRLSDRAITVHSDSSARQVTLRDISTSGFKVRTAEPFATGAKVYVNLAGKDRAATVVWSRGNYTGLEFDIALSPAEVASVHRPGDPTNFRGGHKTFRPGSHRFSEMN